jgi:hypothetical protein
MAKTAVANARCKVPIIGSRSVTTTSPPRRLWIMSKITARPKALAGPEGRGFIFHTVTTPLPAARAIEDARPELAKPSISRCQESVDVALSSIFRPINRRLDGTHIEAERCS